VRFSTLGKSVRAFVLVGILLGIGMAEPVALACNVKLPKGLWICQCDADCACVCIRIG
jgi:hypothetical protein